MFAYMGGFRLVSDDGSKRLQRREEFFNKVVRGDIEIPTVHEGEIQDKSKGDNVAKAVVVHPSVVVRNTSCASRQQWI